MTDTTTLESVLRKTGAIVAGVRPDQGQLRTPCEDYSVDQLVHHIVSWVKVFANAGAGDPQPKDPEGQTIDNASAEFERAAAKAVAGYAKLDDDAPVTLSSGSMPAAASVAMMTGEYLAHGWDLARATGQPVEYTDAEAEAARIGLTPLLSPEYRGPGMPFGHIVEVPDDASGLDRFLGFAGRSPR
ncbi:TIGR03086 family metal-binding protein [Nakamurella panacisegetis]|nr:TIGR03086 family metal-binding protein [Nakamurella panacisegetis]